MKILHLSVCLKTEQVRLCVSLRGLDHEVIHLSLNLLVVIWLH